LRWLAPNAIHATSGDRAISRAFLDLDKGACDDCGFDSHIVSPLFAGFNEEEAQE